MARNIEIKARIPGIAAVLPAVMALATSGPTSIDQDDTFFPCPAGRLKLRAFADDTGELIFYQRPDTAGPKESFYVKTPIPDPQGLRQALTLAYGQAGRVRKHRTLYLAGRTRIHLDRVEGLGEFLELEVVLADGEAPAAGAAEAKALLVRLGIGPDQLLTTAYVDLLAASDSPTGT